MRMTNKRVTSILLSLALAMVIGLFPGMSLTAQADGTVAKVGEVEYNNFNDALTAWNSAANEATLQLVANVETATTITAVGTKTLDLNGFGIKMTGNDSVITVNNGVNLTIIDSNPFSTNESAANLGITGGYITGGKGKIQKNSNQVKGGGIFIGGGGTVNMYGGTIIDCKIETDANNNHGGGGVYIGGTFNMYNGAIVGCSISSPYGHAWGGGVCVDASFNMYGGRIEKNSITGNQVTGGGVWGRDNNLLSGSAVIKGNTANGDTSNFQVNGTDNNYPILKNLNEDAEIYIYTTTIPNDSEDVRFGKDSDKNSIRYTSSDRSSEAGVIYCDGANDWVYINGVAQLRSGAAKHDHVNNSVWLSVAASTNNIENNINLYSVTFNGNGHGTMPDDQMAKKDNTVTKPENPTADGFDFGGWYKDADCTVAWDFGSDTVTENIVLYAKWTLNDAGKPGAKTGLVYTGEELPLVDAPKEDPDGYTIQYSTDDGVTWKDTPTGIAAGDYTVKVKYVGKSDQENFNGEDIPVTIAKKPAPKLKDAQKPQQNDKLEYTGDEQPLVSKPENDPPEGYKIVYAVTTTDEEPSPKDYQEVIPTGKDVGSYTVWYKIVPEDTDNYEESEPAKIQAIINPADAPTPEKPQQPTPKENLVYTGSEQPLVEEPKEPLSGYTVMYRLDDEEWSEKPPKGTDAKEYTVHVMYKGDDDNHKDFLGTDIKVTIAPAVATLTEDQKPQKETITYDGEEHALVTAPKELPEGYTKIEYSVDGGKTWSNKIPTGTDSGDYTVNYRYIGDANHNDITGDDLVLTVTIGKAMELTVEADNVLQGNGARGIPSEIENLEVKLDITITSDDGKTAKTVKPMVLTLDKGKASLTQNAEFDREIEDLAPGKQTVTVSVTPKVVVGQDTIHTDEGDVKGPVKWKYELSAVGEINMKNENVIVRIYLIWDDGSRPEVLKVYALPEDEIGAYKLNDDGTKEYLLFHTYDICMQWLGRDELCRGYERCFHKESPFVNPFVKP